MHVPVLLQEVIDGLDLQPGENCVDGTVGGGGHTKAILDATAPDGIVIGFDRDRERLLETSQALSTYGERFRPIHDSYASIAEHSEALGAIVPVKAVLLDLGLSSFQLDDPERGFSFRNPDAPLDMRYDQGRGVENAADILNTQTPEQLWKLFRQYGEVQRVDRLVGLIEERRGQKPFATVGDLLRVVEEWNPRRGKRKIHPATTVFQALRIAVNDELGELEKFLPLAVNLLAPGGRLAIISFHSLEDRMVKQFFRTAASDCVCPPEIPECRCEHNASLKLITKKPIVPSEEETKTNPRARSAKLRIAEKL